MFGSCFIENIGNLLTRNKFNVNVNPFGVLYNPVSIEQAIRILIEEKEFTENDIFQHNGLYHSFYHHSSLSDIDKDICISSINKSISYSAEDLKKADILFITFGTSYVFHHKEQNIVVGNCHKLPASHFERHKISVEEIVDKWTALIEDLKTINPNLQIIFTVSPIRHLKDGAHDNQLSKATLLLAIDQLCKANSHLHYFPSYEIVLDELRDYRFYNEDMVHPSPLAIQYIWKRFAETYLAPESFRIMDEWSKIYLALNHRPFNEKSEEHKLFLRQTMLKIKAFNDKYPYICCNEELSRIETKL